jgi:orotidine-5'-phosphate decarboxylase
VSYLERLAARTDRVGSCLCLGLDPHPEQLPAGFSRDIEGVEAFGRMLIEAGAPHAAAVKANLAFFEAFGSRGLAALERLRAAVPNDIPFIADAKRGDIGSTAERHAAALFDSLGADAVTASPYLGRDAIEPLAAHPRGFVYLLCRTSNDSAAEVQELPVAGSGASAGEPLFVRIARLAVDWDSGRAAIGLVVGATAPAELEAARAAAPGLSFLVPGVGAQGGAAEPVLTFGPATASPSGGRRGGGLLINVSRGIAGAALGDGPGDPAEAIARAAADWSARLEC